MRIWSLHPKLLDAKGLVALWRETLLAQNVLLGNTKGYTRHPQLERFRAHPAPLAAIGHYLLHVQAEATRRGYQFNAEKIVRPEKEVAVIAVTNGQLTFELDHLKRKLHTRDPKIYLSLIDISLPETHPLFTIIDGPIAHWERP